MIEISRICPIHGDKVSMTTSRPLKVTYHSTSNAFELKVSLAVPKCPKCEEKKNGLIDCLDNPNREEQDYHKIDGSGV